MCALVTGVQTCALPICMEHVPAASAKLVEALAIHDQVQVFVVLHELDLESRHLPDGYVDRDLDGVRGDLPHSSAHRLLDLGRVVVHQIHLSDVSEKMDVVKIGRASCGERVCRYV